MADLAALNSVRSAAGYLPIANYGLIGDCRSAALVGSDGSLDWLCLPRFDDPSLFGRILDAKRGGFWQIRPVGRHVSLQQYRDRSNVLCTRFRTSSGVVVVTDFMPITAATITTHARAHNESRVVRIVTCLAGEVEMESVFDPAPDYGRSRAAFHGSDGHFHGDVGKHHYCVQSTIPLRARRKTFTLTAGTGAAFGLRCGRAGTCGKHPWSLTHAHALLRTTQEFWWLWASSCTYDGPYVEHVIRSALALKLMTYAPTGAIIAAPTTSLPEKIGSYHNYDYRFTWLRDAAFTLYAFFQLGFKDEATAFFGWLRRIGLESGERDVPNLYTLDGSSETPEILLDHLSGYRGSRPVRLGNAAVNQLQLDVYGELLDSAYLYAQYGGTISRQLWRQLRPIVQLAVERWHEPDRSIWEPRGGDMHFTYSTLMCWVAVDRGLRLAQRFHLPHRATEWAAARRTIRATLLRDGFNASVGAFTQTLGGNALDAAVLRISQTRLLDQGDARLRSTVDAIARDLSDGGVLLRRFRRAGNDYGQRSREGAFLLCSFWLADALAHTGQLDDAQTLFENLLALASPLGLYAEEADSVTGEQLGNFPQAFTHLSLVGAAVNIERARHRNLGVRALHHR